MTSIGVAADRIPRPRDHRLDARQPHQGCVGPGDQNMNLMLGFTETMGIDLPPLFP